MRIPSYDDLTPSIPDISPADVFASVARLLPKGEQVSVPRSVPTLLPATTLFACLRSGSQPETIGEIARDFSPRIQRYGHDCVVFDVSGLGRLLGPPQVIGAELARQAAARHPSAFRIAVAPTQISALLLSLTDSPLTVIESHEGAALASLPLRLLQQFIAGVEGGGMLRGKAVAAAKRVEGIFEILQRWGLKTLGDFAALPTAGLSARLGQSGVAWQQLARGVDLHPLVPDPDVPRFIERMELEWPIDGLEPLSFVLARLLEPLSTALERADRAAAAIRLNLRLVDRSTHERALQLPAAMRDPRVLRTLLLLDLESHPPSEAIDVVTVEIDPAPGRVIQYSLLERALPSDETLATLTARLSALVGESRCGSPSVLDTHRPDAFEVRRFAPGLGTRDLLAYASRPEGISEKLRRGLAEARLIHTREGGGLGTRDQGPGILRRFRPPVTIRVSVHRGRPAHVAIDRRGMPGGQVVQAAGPWRSSGGWWDLENVPWDRDAWDVELSDGTVCRLFRERGKWFMEGVVD
jgi:protein ImuB